MVLVSGKEEPGAALSPAMDAIIRIFKRVNGLPENDGDGKTAGAAYCSIRLLVASTQAISLIGKQGSLIKSIQENTGASVRVLSNDDMPVYATSDERIVELQGEGLKVLKALEAVGHLRKFLVDHSVLPLFEKSYNAPTTQERQVDTWADKTLLHATPQTSLGADYPVSMKRDPLFLDRESQMESHIASSRHSLYAPDHSLGSRSSTIGRSGGPVVTQMAQTMQIPLAYAEDIIGVQGANIDYIRRTSGAILTVQESRGLPDEITVEIKGTSSQVQAAQQLIQYERALNQDSSYTVAYLSRNLRVVVTESHFQAVMEAGIQSEAILLSVRQQLLLIIVILRTTLWRLWLIRRWRI
ncbi:UNVERIFIED_CONTAM: RNA-binding KH domain-containing protein PEPPER [Sesamum radiatum]|uniref:RNA-binding KH domain-containing protein PEPPER n=1 Tax=Sesamum radiatum TaxID=300843 RepID=A0AAW2KMY7_SESRA